MVSNLAIYKLCTWLCGENTSHVELLSQGPMALTKQVEMKHGLDD